jgi:hypothetical protein
MVTDLMRETMASSVITQSIGVDAKLSAIAKFRNYKRLYDKHHFILMAMKMHNTPGHDMDHFIKECAHLFCDRQLEGHLSLFFCIQFFKQHVNSTLQHALTFVIKRKIMLSHDVCSKPPIIIKFHVLRANDIRRVVGEITSYSEKD